jgi:hypothetical protein
MATPIIPPRRREEFFNEDGTFTLRALRFFEDLTTTSNTNTEDIEDDSGIGSLNAILLRIQDQVGSGKPLTIDTTGFTIDTTLQSIDQTEA